MGLVIITVISIIISIILAIQLSHKQVQDTKELDAAKRKLDDIKRRYDDFSSRLEDAESQYEKILDEYQQANSAAQDSLDEYFAEQKQKRQKELDNYFTDLWEQTRKQLDLKKQAAEKANNESIDAMRATTSQLFEQNNLLQENLKANMDIATAKFNAILEPLKQYEKDKLEKLFYTIQIPEEYRDDINFLLTTVNQKVRHPDVISKLVWTEYIRPYIIETFKRVGIEAKPGIYKITNIENGKSYIGKSTDIKKRLADHFKSAVGIQSIADQLIHHAILNDGLWNWTIEYIIYCDKEQLNELEKYYIDFFKTQEFGYNRKEGG